MVQESINERARQLELTHKLLRRIPVPFIVDGEQYVLQGRMYSTPRWILEGTNKDSRKYRLHLEGGKTYEPDSRETIFMLDFMRFTTEEIPCTDLDPHQET